MADNATPARHTFDRRARRSRIARRKFIPILTLMLTFMMGSLWLPQPAAASDVTLVRGTWTTGDATFSTTVPAGPNLRIGGSGASVWSGDLVGATTFTFRVLQLARSGVIRGQLNETFTGSVAGVGTGTLIFVEQVVQSTTTGDLTITAEITHGTGALSTLHGALRFTGSTDAAENGGGDYTGRFTTSH